jgi:hypothetical protein
MKKLLLSLSLFVGFGSFGQEYYNASMGADFANGSIIEVDGDTNNWLILDVSAFAAPLNGFGEALCSFSFINGIGPLNPDNIYVTPPIDLTGASGVINLSWKAGSSEATSTTFYEEFYSVYVFNGMSGAAAAFAAAPLHTGALTAGQTIFNLSYPVSSFAGSDSLLVAFRHHNCTDEYILMIDDINVSGTAGINENVINANVYPNPANDVLNIAINEEIESVSIVTLDGKVVATSTSSTVNVADLTSGMYVYEITTANGNVARDTFVKK